MHVRRGPPLGARSPLVVCAMYAMHTMCAAYAAHGMYGMYSLGHLGHLCAPPAYRLHHLLHTTFKICTSACYALRMPHSHPSRSCCHRHIVETVSLRLRRRDRVAEIVSSRSCRRDRVVEIVVSPVSIDIQWEMSTHMHVPVMPHRSNILLVKQKMAHFTSQCQMMLAIFLWHQRVRPPKQVGPFPTTVPLSGHRSLPSSSCPGSIAPSKSPPSAQVGVEDGVPTEGSRKKLVLQMKMSCNKSRSHAAMFRNHRSVNDTQCHHCPTHAMCHCPTHAMCLLCPPACVYLPAACTEPFHGRPIGHAWGHA